MNPPRIFRSPRTPWPPGHDTGIREMSIRHRRTPGGAGCLPLGKLKNFFFKAVGLPSRPAASNPLVPAHLLLRSDYLGNDPSELFIAESVVDFD
jgi:hypothetical protein